VSPPLRWSRAGFTLIELLIVMTLIGALASFALPKYQEIQRRERVFAARREVANQVARARTVAVQRGCRTVLHLDAGGDRVYVTGCRTTGTGTETVGAVTLLQASYQVDLTSTSDSLAFAPTGVGLGTAPIVLGFSRSGVSERLDISSLGKATW
jgi:prepilin-type N-terminal cleavage/methylation domain-containing protein